jgi:hypothetical protein
MNIKPINKLSALICVICGLTLLPLTAFADNFTAPTGVTTSQTSVSYNDSDPTLPALNVSGEGTTYNGTNITLTATANSTTNGNAIGKGAYVTDATLFLNNSAITTSGSYGSGIYLGTSTGTLNNVTIATTEYGSYGVYVMTSSLTMTGGRITTDNNFSVGIILNGTSSGTLSNTTIATTGLESYGVYARNASDLTLTDSNITSGSAYALYFYNGSRGTVNLNHNTLIGGLYATGTSTLTLTGSNVTVLTGNVTSNDGATVNLNLTGEGTELHGNFSQNATGIINLTLGTGALLEGGGTLDSLTRANGAVIGYTGLITVTDSITIDGTVTIDLSNLTETGEYNLLNWSSASVTGDITNAQFTNETAGVEGTFSVANNQLTFNATAVPEPSTWFLFGTGLGLLLLTAHYRRRKARS